MRACGRTVRVRSLGLRACNSSSKSYSHPTTRRNPCIMHMCAAPAGLCVPHPLTCVRARACTYPRPEFQLLNAPPFWTEMQDPAQRARVLRRLGDIRLEAVAVLDRIQRGAIEV